jgi:hypothetical protein
MFSNYTCHEGRVLIGSDSVEYNNDRTPSPFFSQIGIKYL